MQKYRNVENAVMSVSLILRWSRPLSAGLFIVSWNAFRWVSLFLLFGILFSPFFSAVRSVQMWRTMPPVLQCLDSSAFYAAVWLFVQAG